MKVSAKFIDIAICKNNSFANYDAKVQISSFAMQGDLILTIQYMNKFCFVYSIIGEAFYVIKIECILRKEWRIFFSHMTTPHVCRQIVWNPILCLHCWLNFACNHTFDSFFLKQLTFIEKKGNAQITNTFDFDLLIYLKRWDLWKNKEKYIPSCWSYYNVNFLESFHMIVHCSSPALQ